MASDRELKTFKTEIDLREFAGSLGFELNRRESWRGSAVMERGKANKIIINSDANGHYIYFSVKENHSGTIIDLAQRYVTRNFGEIRKALRRWSETPASPARLQATLPLEKTK